MKLFKRKVLATQEVLLESVFEETPSEEDDEEARTLMSMTRKEMEEADPESITEDILETDSVDTSDLIEEVEEPLLDSHIIKAIDKAWKWPADAVITYDENSDCNDVEVVVDLEKAVMDQDQDEMKHTYQSQEGKSPKLDKMFKEQAHLDKNLKLLQILKCNVCGLSCKSFSDLCSHQEEEHKIPRNLGYVVSGIHISLSLNSFPLGLILNSLQVCCNNRFNIFTVYEHLTFHVDKDAFLCSACSTQCLSFYGLVSHRNRLHGKPGAMPRLAIQRNKTIESKRISEDIPETPFQCPICCKSFRTRKYLNEHKRAHKKSYKCNLCPLVFSYRQTLWRHKTTAHPDNTAVSSTDTEEVTENLEYY